MNPNGVALSKRAEREQISKLSGAEVVPGGFYTSRLPGGWQDALSGIKIPGPKAIVDSITLRVIELIEIPEPLQLPTHRWCSFAALPENERCRLLRDEPETGERQQRVLVSFSTNTLDEYTIGLTLAIRCDDIQHISDDEMKSEWPEAWGRRQAKIIHSEPEGTSDFAALLDSAMQSRRIRLEAGKSG
jgi:hypothetical protein